LSNSSLELPLKPSGALNEVQLKHNLASLTKPFMRGILTKHLIFPKWPSWPYLTIRYLGNLATAASILRRAGSPTSPPQAGVIRLSRCPLER